MVEHHEVIEPFLGVSSGALGVASFMVGQHMDTLKNTLIELERLHVEQHRQYGHLNSPDFFAKRKRLMKKLDAGLEPLVRKATGLSDHPKLKRALGLSTRSAATKIYETCRTGREEECRHAKFVEGAKLSGNVLGGVVAGRLAPTLAPMTCAAIGMGTAGAGGVVCMLVISGLLAAQMGDSGSQAGELIGEKLYEVSK